MQLSHSSETKFKIFFNKQMNKPLLVEFDVHGQLLISKRTMKENTQTTNKGAQSQTTWNASEKGL